MDGVHLSKEHEEDMRERFRQNNIDDIEEAVKQVKKWINEQPHLPSYTANDNRIRNILYSRNFSIERTKQAMDSYFTLKNFLPEFFKDRELTHHSVQTAFDTIYFLALPGCTADGSRVLYAGIRKPDLEKVTPELMYKLASIVVDILLMEDLIKSFILVLDTKNIPWQLFFKHTASLCKKALVCGRKCYPVKINAIYGLNGENYSEYMFGVFRNFLSEKLRNRITITNKDTGYQALLDLVGEKNVPYEFGGTWGKLETLREQWWKLILSYKDWFDKDKDTASNEKLRCEDVYDPDALVGMAGSFRQLNID